MRLIISCFLLAAIGCQKEQTTFYSAYLKNKTTHNISVQPYFNGIATADKIISLAINDSFQIANGFDRGIVSSFIF